jgi:hypothetical protein
MMRVDTNEGRTVHKETNVGFRETNVEAKKNNMWTRITRDETLLVAVKTASAADAIILVVVMSILSTIIPSLRELQLDVRGELGEGCIHRY